MQKAKLEKRGPVLFLVAATLLLAWVSVIGPAYHEHVVRPAADLVCSGQRVEEHGTTISRGFVVAPGIRTTTLNTFEGGSWEVELVTTVWVGSGSYPSDFRIAKHEKFNHIPERLFPLKSLYYDIGATVLSDEFEFASIPTTRGELFLRLYICPIDNEMWIEDHTLPNPGDSVVS